MAGLLLVDDEVPVRLALRSLGNWSEAGIDVLYEASNGREALEQLRLHPDIAVMVTDIRMPVMDGLELLAQARVERPRLPVIVLSAFGDYDLIREAFRQGARDYILKPRMEPDAVVAMVKDLLPSGTEVQAGAIDHRGLTLEWLRDCEARAEESDALPPPPPGHVLPHGPVSVLCLWIDDFRVIQARFVDHELSTFQNRVLEVLGRAHAEHSGGLSMALSPQMYLMLWPMTSQTWLIEARQNLQEVRHQLRHFLDVTASVGVSAPIQSPEQLRLGLREARALVQMRHLLGRDRLICGKDVEGFILVDRAVPHLDFSLFHDQVLAGSFDPALASYRSIVAEFAACRFPGIEPYRMGARQIFQELLQLLTKVGTDAAEALGSACNPLETIDGAESVKELSDWLEQTGALVLDSLRRKRYLVTSHHVLKARRHLEAHYRDPGLSMEETARLVGLSRTYFSTLFEKETGQSFTEYLNRLRLAEAQRLLKTTGLKLYEISERCGFNSVEYFGRVFRKLCGMTPAQYR